MPRSVLRTLALLAAGLGLALAASPARAADPGAPKGAPSFWLPSAEWVQERWLPFDVPDLERAFGLSLIQIQVRISDRRTLARVARARHLNWHRVLAATMAPRRAHVSAARFRELTAHARWIFTRGHLATHMLFHGYHFAAINRALLRFLHLHDWFAYERYQVRGWSIARIGRHNGVSPRTLTRKIVAVMRRTARIGVARRLVSRAQADRFFDVSAPGVDIWIGWHRHHARRASVASLRSTAATPVFFCHG